MAKYLNEAGTRQLISNIKTKLDSKVNLNGATMTGGLVAPSLTASSSTTASLVNLNNGNIIIKAPTTSSTNLTFANRTSNPSITFADSTETTSAALIYRDNSLNLLGKTANAYFTAPNIKATGSFYGNLSGNASTATTASTASKVANKLTFKNVKSANLEYDGSTAVTIDKTAIINILGYAPTDVESALEYKGILNDKNILPNSTDTKNGDVYVIGTGGTLTVNSSDKANTTINSNSDPDVEAGDMIVAYKTVDTVSWTVIQKNIDGAVRSTSSSTENAIARFSDTSGKIIKNSTATIDNNGSFKLKGHMTLDPAYDSAHNLYNQGLRINQASDNWAGVFLGGDKDSNNGQSVWVIGRRGTKGTVSGEIGDLTLEYGDATGNGLTLPAGDGDPKWKGNKIWHAGNDGSGSGLDADLLDGQDSSYYTNAGNLSSGTILNARLPDRLKEYGHQEESTANSAVTQGWHLIADNDTYRPPFKNSDSSTKTDYRVMSTAYNDTWLQQLATNYHSNDMFIRRNQGGTWSGWTSIVKTEEGLASPTGTTNAVPKWDGTKNSTLKDTGVIIDDSNNIKIPGLITQGSPSDDTTITKMNRFASDLFVSGNGGLSTNNPKVSGIYLAKNSNNDIPHIDIVTGAQATYSYIDFNKAGVDRDFDFRILVNHSDGNVEMKWAREFSNKSLKLTDSFEAATIKKTGGADTSILLAGGGTKLISDFALKTDIPAALKNPHALTFGTKTYDGSSAQTITAADLGALTSHQDISGKVNKSGDTMTGSLTITQGSAINVSQYNDAGGVSLMNNGGGMATQFGSSARPARMFSSIQPEWYKNGVSQGVLAIKSDIPANYTNSSLTPSQCTANGFYYVQSSTNSLTDANGNPFLQYHAANNDFRILATAYSSDWVQQIATDFRSTHIYYRIRNDGIWGSWTEIAKISDITTSIDSINETLANKADAKHMHTISDITDISNASVKYAASAETATTASKATEADHVKNQLKFKNTKNTDIAIYNGSDEVTIDKATIIDMLGYTPTDVESALEYKGTLSSTNENNTIELPNSTNTKNGDVYVIGTDGTLIVNSSDNNTTINSNSDPVVEAGDMIIAYKTVSDVSWTVIQKNVDGVLIGPSTNTANTVPVFSADNSHTLTSTDVRINKNALTAASITVNAITAGTINTTTIKATSTKTSDFYATNADKTWNFWNGTDTSDDNLYLKISADSVTNKKNTFTWPSSGGTLALTSDINNSLKDYVTTNDTNQLIKGLKTFSSGDFGNALSVRRTESDQGAVIKFENKNTSSSSTSEVSKTLGYIGMTGSANSSLYRWNVDGSASYKVWDAGNDGSGSGLDADLLDGHDSGYFATADHTHANYVDQGVGLKLKGTLTSTNSTISLPAAGSVVNGDLYLIGKDATLATNGTSSVNSNYSSVVEAGDMILASKDSSGNVSWSVIQKNINGALIGPATNTSRAIPVFSAANSNTLINTGVTISHEDILSAPRISSSIIETGDRDDSYVQTKKIRGGGNAPMYSHAIDLGYHNHNRVDFYEWGGIYNFWKNESEAITTDENNLCLQIGLSSVKNKKNTFTWPTKSGEFALTADVVTKENILADNTDLNTIQTTGFYTLPYSRMDNGPKDEDATSTSGQLIVCHGGKDAKGGVDSVAQIAFPHDTSKMYIRTGTTSTFHDWKRVVTDDELNRAKIISLLGYTPSDINDAIEYKGTLTSTTSTILLPEGSKTKHGDAYIMGVSGTLVNNTTNGSSTVDSAFSSLKTVEIGDMIIANKTDKSSNNVTWSIIQKNIDNNVVGNSNEHTDNTIPVWNAATGGVLKDTKATITASTSNNVTKTTITADYFNGLASNATVAVSANSIKVTSCISSGNTTDTYKLLIAESSGISPKTSTNVHAFNEVSIDPDGFSVTVNNVTTKYPKISLGTVRVDGDDVVNKRNIGSMSVSYATTASTALTATTATKAVQDGNGNTITTKYATLDTQQNFKEIKSFGSGAVFGSNTSNTTFSSTGCKIVYNATDECLDFIFN